MDGIFFLPFYLSLLFRPHIRVHFLNNLPEFLRKKQRQHHRWIFFLYSSGILSFVFVHFRRSNRFHRWSCRITLGRNSSCLGTYSPQSLVLETNKGHNWQPYSHLKIYFIKLRFRILCKRRRFSDLSPFAFPQRLTCFC